MLWQILMPLSMRAALLQVVGDSILLGRPQGNPCSAQLSQHHLHAVSQLSPAKRSTLGWTLVHEFRAVAGYCVVSIYQTIWPPVSVENLVRYLFTVPV